MQKKQYATRKQIPNPINQKRVKEDQFVINKGQIFLLRISNKIYKKCTTKTIQCEDIKATTPKEVGAKVAANISVKDPLNMVL